MTDIKQKTKEEVLDEAAAKCNPNLRVISHEMNEMIMYAMQAYADQQGKPEDGGKALYETRLALLMLWRVFENVEKNKSQEKYHSQALYVYQKYASSTDILRAQSPSVEGQAEAAAEAQRLYPGPDFTVENPFDVIKKMEYVVASYKRDAFIAGWKAGQTGRSHQCPEINHDPVVVNEIEAGDEKDKEIERLKGLLQKEVIQTGGTWENYSLANNI